MQTWKASVLNFFDRRIFTIFLFGFSSGLPFLLTLSTLAIWLKESGVNNTVIGFFVLATLPYTLKFLFGPMVSKVKIPFLTFRLGQLRSWALLAQLFLIFMMIGMGSSNPENEIIVTALWAFGVALGSAIQDVAIEAYRIEISTEDQRGASASATVFGWRLGMMVAGAGALFLATLYSWQIAYDIMAALMIVGVFTTLFSPSPPELSFFESAREMKVGEGAWIWITKTYGIPLRELLQTYDWRIVLAFIFFYKVGDTTLNVMNTPFLVETGFTKFEIAHIAKLFGISAMIFGGFLGGVFLTRFGLLASLILCAVLQCLSSLMFAVQAVVGHHLTFLIFSIGIENLTSGFGTTAFIAYLSSLCLTPHIATHFAILSSAASVTRIILSIFAGILADLLPWPFFYCVTAIACLPCLFLLIKEADHFSYKRGKIL